MKTIAFTSLVLVVGISAASKKARWEEFFTCVTSDLGAWSLLDKDMLCAESFYHFATMQTLQCSNCDKYFHCIANREVVRTCGEQQTTTNIMIALSKCRELSQTGMHSQDGADDMAANEYGRNGGDCYRKYGCAYRCHYHPADGSCVPSNCD